MENKYYRPTKEEFHLGFEFEEEFKNPHYIKLTKPSNDTYEWIKLKLDTSHSISRIISKLKQNRVRVKYLDNQDLIELGWECVMDNDTYQTKDGDLLILNYFVEDKGWYIDYSENENQFGFGGWVKNKSEMHKLMEMLNIKIDK